MKISLIGGGSANWMRGILKDLMLCEVLDGSTLVLNDPDQESTLLIQALAQRYNELLGKNFKAMIDDDFESAVSQADFVIFTFSPGSLDAFWHDLEIPTKYGIHQPVSMAIGPSGISAALRTVPVGYEMAKIISRVAPQAWILSLTNPMMALTRAISMAHRSDRVIGLCHGLFDTEPALTRFWGVSADRLSLEVGGINHFIWITRIYVDGVDRYDELRDYAATHDSFEELYTKDSARGIATTPFYSPGRAQILLLRTFGYLPCNNDRHTVEFIPWLCNSQAEWGARFGVQKTTVEYRKQMREKYRQWIRDVIEARITPNLTRTREEVSDIMRTVVTHHPDRFIMNLPNRGQIRNLPAGAVVETLGMVDRGYAAGIAIGDLPESIAVLCRLHIQVGELTVQAALTGDRKVLLEALYLDPLTALMDAYKVPEMMEELLEANREYLPRFF